MTEAYLDNSATTRPCREAVEKITQMLTENYGNPSSLHSRGLQAQLAVEQARESVAKAIGAEKNEIIFTSGGTEANNLAVLGAAQSRYRSGKKLITTAIEHPSVLEAVKALETEGWEVVRLAPDSRGCFSTEALANALDGSTVLVSLMLVNNETGAIQPLEEAARLIKRSGAPALLHCDAVQAFGKLPINVKKTGVDLMTVSAHKIHGPKGVGALYVRSGVRIIPRAFGGGQERGLRSGTESTPLIAGFGGAVDALPNTAQQLNTMRELKIYAQELLGGLDGIEINSPDDALPYILNISCPGIRSEVMLHHLSAGGVFVSSGSACAKGQKSHVLTAMGLDRKRIDGALRISFSRFTTKEEIRLLASRLEDGLKRLIRSRG